MCKCWGYSGRLYEKCHYNVPFEDCYEIVIDTINYVLAKRVWENPESSLYNDPAAPDKAFHIVLKRQLHIVLAKLSADRRQANFNTLSIDGAQEEFSDAAEGLLNISDESSEIDTATLSLIDFIKSKTPVQILFLDQICFGNWSSLKNAITNVKRILPTDFAYYNLTYGLTEKQFTMALRDVKITTNSRLMSELKKVLYLARKEYYD